MMEPSEPSLTDEQWSTFLYLVISFVFAHGDGLSRKGETPTVV